ncbi:MAG TPA: MFS transporter [Rhodoglobus sp.]|nr:MFS transporter [Rhodoglobus sp.]
MTTQPPPSSIPPAGGVAETEIQTLTGSVATRERVGAGYIWLVVLATFGAFTALVAPIGISLSLRIQQLAPENVEVLGYVIGIGAAAAAIWGPILGMLSDRTRSRFGRRRPYAFFGAILGVVGLTIIAAVDSVPMLAVGWVVTQIGWSSVMATVTFSLADRLPEEQRGKVAGLTGFIQMIASVLGVGLASAFIGNNFLVFLVPGGLGLLATLLFVLLVRERDSRETVVVDKMTPAKAISQMVFNPARHPDFAWNWLGRLLFNIGVTFATTFTTLFLASRLSDGGQVADIGGIVTILSLVGVVATAGGALASGFLSDRLRKRRIFVLLSGIIFTTGALTLAFGGSNLGLIVTGSVLANLGLGIFSAVDQAIVLDVLPYEENQAGRFLGINGYATSLAQAIAPVVAAPLLLIGVVGAERNYGLLFVVAAACTLVGGTIVTLFVRKSN